MLMEKGPNNERQPQLAFVPPMLLRRVPVLPEGNQWQYEAKWDGFRMQTLKCRDQVRLLSRSGADYTKRFPEVANAVARLKPAILHLDGELVATDRTGRPSFQVLQSGRPVPNGWQIGYYAFDILRQGNRRFDTATLTERRSHMKELLAGSGVKFSATLDGSAAQVVKAVREHGLEGVVAKRVDSLYEPGKRTGSWVKLPCKQTGMFVIGGYVPAGKSFATLLVGRFDGGKFRFAGKVRHGFDAASRTQIWNAVKRLSHRNCPFGDLPNVKTDPFNENVTPEEMCSLSWVRPELNIAVQFAEWTRMGSLRHTEFAGACSALNLA